MYIVYNVLILLQISFPTYPKSCHNKTTRQLHRYSADLVPFCAASLVAVPGRPADLLGFKRTVEEQDPEQRLELISAAHLMFDQQGQEEATVDSIAPKQREGGDLKKPKNLRSGGLVGLIRARFSQPFRA